MVARGIGGSNNWELTMVYRVSYVRDGTTSYEALSYEKFDDAIKFVRGLWKKRLLDTATIEDHEGNRTEWPEIKKRFKKSN
jgi:hypothetical protein